jgi:hypothetical protein
MRQAWSIQIAVVAGRYFRSGNGTPAGELVLSFSAGMFSRVESIRLGRREPKPQPVIGWVDFAFLGTLHRTNEKAIIEAACFVFTRRFSGLPASVSKVSFCGAAVVHIHDLTGSSGPIPPVSHGRLNDGKVPSAAAHR